MRPAAQSFASLLALFATACQPPVPSRFTLELQDGWALAGVDTFTSPVPATVPGTVHTDLLAAGLIPDPFWRDNELALQWIGEEDWLYSTTFRADPELLEREVVELVFHGLDTFAEVRMNGAPILSTDNMFRRWEIEVGKLLQTGVNTLEVLFRSPLTPALEARAALPYELPAGNDRGVPPSRVFVRKAAFHYGWDWGPRLVTSGVWRPVELVAWSGARISDMHLTADSMTSERAFLHARVELRVSEEEAERRAAGGGLPATLTLSSPGGEFPAVGHRAHLTSGSNWFRIPLEIPNPRRWWPNGLGEPHLYTVQAELRAGRRTDTVDRRIGLRTVELVTEPDSVGESFYFRVNGVPVFMKGANVIPLDHFTPRVTEEDYRDLFQDVKDANMNMLRVWGGGIYENDAFYDLADESGILIWQDFMFANGMYPGDSAFLASVQAEATDQVRRLRNHPSLALWCGNNEMEEAWRNWGWARRYDAPEDSVAVREAYEATFHRVLPEVIAQEDPGRSYWPSSPSLGWGDPESLLRGDSHYWGVWHGQEPFEVFREKLPRFMSEYGFQALPPLETVEAFTEEADRSLLNPIFLVHQKHPIGNEIMAEYMGRDYPVPSRFEDFLYVSQLLQGRGMRMAFEAHRRSFPRTMGTLYWQLNDTWPVVSWSSRDYFGRWKALHYAAREAFSPLMLSPVIEGDTVSVWVVSDLQEPLVGTLQLLLTGFDGEIAWEREVAVEVGPNESGVFWAGSLKEVLGDADPARSVLAVRFDPGRSSQAEDRPASPSGPAGVGSSPAALLFFALPKELALGTPTIRISGDGPHTGEGVRGPWVTLTLETDLLARDVFLSLGPGEEADALSSLGTHHFEENFFHLLPGHPRNVRLFTDLPPREVESRIRIRTLAEIPQEGVPADSTLVVPGMTRAIIDSVAVRTEGAW